jgi:ribosomal protein S18 acetylase RimI-like enzyme
MAAFLLRPADPADALLLIRTCWSGRALSEAIDFLETLSGRMAEGKAWGLVAAAEHKLVGFGQILRFGQRAEIADLIVAEGWRGQGIGTALIRELAAFAAVHGIRTIEIGAEESNLRALALYRRLGFHGERRVILDVGRGPEPVIYLWQESEKIIHAGK